MTSVLAGAGFTWVRWAGADDGKGRPQYAPIKAETATVVKMDMTNGKSLPATLGYGTARRVKGAQEGVVTWLPARAPRSNAGSSSTGWTTGP